jgi:iron complex outermembrane receptor protein
MYMAWDPMRCPDPTLVIPPFAACLLESFEYVTSGNAALKPETSESLSIGFTADVARWLSVSANYWKIEHENRIVSPGIDLILENEQALGPEFVVRNDASPEDIALGFPGNIERVNNTFINLAKHNVSGYDIDANINFEFDAIGTLNSRLLWTILDSSEFAFNASDPLQELAGSYGHPENRASLDTYLTTNNWLFSVFGRWTDGYDDPNLEKGVNSQLEWDVQITNYSFDKIRITLGVFNLFDEPPPFSVGTFNAQGFNTQLHSMRGRTFYGRLTVTL